MSGRGIRRALLGMLLVLPIIGGIVGIKLFQFKAMAASGANMVMPPSPVNVVDVREQQWQPRVAAVGSVMAVQGTVVSAEAEGVVRKITFAPGAQVQAGDELVQFDVEIEQAQLAAATAAADWARVSFERAQELNQTHTISQAELDQAASGQKQADAQVENLRAVIAKKTVRAPFAGKLGIQQLSVGQFIQKGQPLVSLQALDPVYVEFSLPQQRLGEVAEGLTVAVTSDAYPDQRFEGTITAVNPNVDAATRNVRIQATLTNADGRLRPGMFVAVEMLLARREAVLFIPATAVMHSPFGDSVFVVQAPSAAGAASTNASGTSTTNALVVQQQFVRLGVRQGDFVAVLDGVTAGQQIVSTGVFKLQSGMPVVIDNTLAPTFSLEPKTRNT